MALPKTGVMHNTNKKINKKYMIFWSKHCQFALEIVDFQSLKSVANLKIS